MLCICWPLLHLLLPASCWIGCNECWAASCLARGLQSSRTSFAKAGPGVSLTSPGCQPEGVTSPMARTVLESLDLPDQLPEVSSRLRGQYFHRPNDKTRINSSIRQHREGHTAVNHRGLLLLLPDLVGKAAISAHRQYFSTQRLYERSTGAQQRYDRGCLLTSLSVIAVIEAAERGSFETHSASWCGSLTGAVTTV